MGFGRVVTLVAIVVALVAVYFNVGPTFDPASVRGKRVLVTDATSALGQQLSLEYARLGAALLLTARDEAPLQSLADECRKVGAKRVEAVAGDVTTVQHRSRLANEAERRLGGLDHLVLNHVDCTARMWLGTDRNLTDLDRTMNANFFSYVDLTSKALPLLRRAGGGVGVLSSLAAQVPVPLMASYSASEAALRSFFSSLRQELHRDRSVVSITTFLLGLVAGDDYAGMVVSHFPPINSYFVATPGNAAVAVVRSVATRQAEVIYPPLARFQYLFHFILPEIYEYNWHYLPRPAAVVD